MDESHLLYSLIEKVLILYKEQMTQNATKMCQEDIFKAGPIVVPWRLIVLSLTVWFLTILTWATITLRLIKFPNRNLKQDMSKAMNSKHSCAPNYHTHFHCTCRKKIKHRTSASAEGLSENQLLDNFFETGGMNENVVDGFSQSHSGNQARMELETDADVYEIAI
ncbi:uncharacterized protein LOC135945725 [Cloeon dipterum]|uniref:uncharacterized protein LOC135945725 n=1 Tax=Cloeon dipterum TaxID=197152 RepID=UPI00321FEFF4